MSDTLSFGFFGAVTYQIFHMRELLNSDLVASLSIARRNDRAVGALADQLDGLILDRQLEGDASEVSARVARDITRHRDATCLFRG